MIKVPSGIFGQMKEHGETSFPNECCGVLMGKGGKEGRAVLEILRIDNSFDDAERYHRFLITPDQYRNAEKIAREKKLDIIGFYHSHPDSPSIASKYDLEHAFPWFSYIIMSVMKKKYHDVHSWVMSEDRNEFKEEEVIIR
jgi:proteasome lid subunit RPN8/RPN11